MHLKARLAGEKEKLCVHTRSEHWKVGIYPVWKAEQQQQQEKGQPVRLHTCIHSTYVCICSHPPYSKPTQTIHKPTASEQQTFWPTHPHPESSRPRQQRESQTLRRSWTTCLLRPAFSTHSSSRLVSDAVVVPPTTRAV